MRIDKEAGRRLKKLRDAHGLSQRALAKRAGVSHATISLIERGEIDPSLGLFKNVLEGIPYSIAQFFATPSAEKLSPFLLRSELLEIAGGAISCRQVGHDLRNLPLQILHERYAPRADTGPSLIRHAAFEGGVVLKGRLEVTAGDRCQVLGTGDAYLFDSRLPHRFRNVGSEECELVSACSPPSF